MSNDTVMIPLEKGTYNRDLLISIDTVETVARRWTVSFDITMQMTRPMGRVSKHIARVTTVHIDGLAQGIANSSALAMDLLQSCTKP